MRSPTEVLSKLNEKSQDKTYRFQRLYRNLYNPEFYMLAYRNVYANQGSMTPGVDGTTMDGMSKQRIEKLIESLKDQSYQPNPARRTYIAKKSNFAKKRPLGIPSGNDKLVQEVVRMMLEAIYEPTFSEHSHGFRPRRSCHGALKEIERTFTGATWFIEGDITACFDSFEHHVLINLLRKRIDDEKFIALMWKFLKAGYMEQWTYHATYSGTPQGSGMSPVLANIYLHELDVEMEELRSQFYRGTQGKRITNRAYGRIKTAAHVYKKANAPLWDELGTEEKKARAKHLREMKNAMYKLPSTIFCDEAFKRLQYVRYADDFIISVIGSKADAENIKSEIGRFLKEKLHLTLSADKTKITHGSKRARFLGYDITISHDQTLKRQANGVKRRAYCGAIKLLVPHEKWEAKLREYKAIRFTKDVEGKEHWKAIHRGGLINKPDIEILARYNSEVRGLYNYYCIAHNAHALGKFGGLMKHSMLRTFAGKYRTTARKIKERYTQNGNFTITYTTKRGPKQSVFYNGGYKHRDLALYGAVDVLPAYRRYDHPNSLAARLKAGSCELCGSTEENVEMHQVKALKDLQGNQPWEKLMKQKRRKTLVVCQKCHEKIHSCD